MTRWKAFAIHLLASVLALGGVLAALVWIWYPPPLFSASGVQQFATVFVAVDIVIGPLLTLIVYNASKRGNRFDVICISLMQLAAFAYGLNVVRETRPVYLVASEGRIAMVTANMLDDSERDQAPPAYRTNPLTRPQLVSVVEPEDPVEFGKRLSRMLNTGHPTDSTPNFFEPYENIATQLLAQARPVSALATTSPQAEAEVQRFTRRHSRTVESLVFVPFRAPERRLSAALDAQSGAFVGVLDIDPTTALSDP